jgi:hypothetical protein
MPSPIETLLAIEEIKGLKARYFRLMDTHDWTGFRDLFTQDAVFDVRGALEEAPDLTGQAPIHGADAIAAYVSAGIDPISSAHYGHMPEIEIFSDDHARGIWALADVLRTPTGEPFRVFYGYGHYHEDYRKTGGRWRISSLRLTRLMVETQ